MISLITCSISPTLLGELDRNVAETIGTEYELISWDNSKTRFGISRVYNMMAERAKFSIICFLHEDVSFITAAWGQILLNLFSDSATGLIGLAGSKYKSQLYSGWYTGIHSLDRYNIFQGGYSGEHLHKNPKFGVINSQVICLDGVFLASRKSVWQTIKFDEVHLKGFHYYDIDFSIRAARMTKLIVTFQIDMVHKKDVGSYDDNWIGETVGFHERMKSELPCSVDHDVPPGADLTIARTWLDWLKTFRISNKGKVTWIKNQRLHRFPSLWYSILKFLLYKPLRLKAIHDILRRKRLN